MGHAHLRRLQTGMENDVLTFLLSLLIVGAIAGYLARLIVPGRDPMGIGATILLGVVGSFVGGLIGSVVGSVLALLAYRARNRRRLPRR